MYKALVVFVVCAFAQGERSSQELHPVLTDLDLTQDRHREYMRHFFSEASPIYKFMLVGDGLDSTETAKAKTFLKTVSSKYTDKYVNLFLLTK